MRIALAQINPTVGDFAGNVALMRALRPRRRARGADLVVFPELSFTGYPPRDLVEKPSFVERCEAELDQPREATATCHSPSSPATWAAPTNPTGKRATNSAAVIRAGKIVFRQTKMLLPTYDVFDEARYFVPGEHADLWQRAATRSR